jgi:hypothetical protein
VLAHGFAAHPKTRDEFDLGGVSASHSVLLDLKAQPFATCFEFELSRALAAVPSGQEIRYVALHKSAVARAHQAFGVRRVLVDVVRTATVSQAQRLAFGGGAAAWAECQFHGIFL